MLEGKAKYRRMMRHWVELDFEELDGTHVLPGQLVLVVGLAMMGL